MANINILIIRSIYKINMAIIRDKNLDITVPQGCLFFLSKEEAI